MPKSSKRRSPKSATARAMTAKPPQPAIIDPEKKNDAGSKQARVIEMLRSPTGMTIAAMMKETGWREAGRSVFAPAGDQPNAHRVPTRHEPVNRRA
jgi:Protein of unknown function (DUF3489)